MHVPPNLSKVKSEIIDYYENGRFAEEMESVVDNAINEFEQLEFNDSSTVVFDVDETALSNYEVMKELDFGYVPVKWDEWIEEIRAPAVPHMKKLFDFLVEKNAKIIFITGRKDYQYEPTYINLKAEGFLDFDTLIVRKTNEYDLDAVKYKSGKREELENAGYRIIGSVGDQNSDLDGSFSGIKIKIPNYIYQID